MYITATQNNYSISNKSILTTAAIGLGCALAIFANTAGTIRSVVGRQSAVLSPFAKRVQKLRKALSFFAPAQQKRLQAFTALQAQAHELTLLHEIAHLYARTPSYGQLQHLTKWSDEALMWWFDHADAVLSLRSNPARASKLMQQIESFQGLRNRQEWIQFFSASRKDSTTILHALRVQNANQIKELLSNPTVGEAQWINRWFALENNANGFLANAPQAFQSILGDYPTLPSISAGEAKALVEGLPDLVSNNPAVFRNYQCLVSQLTTAQKEALEKVLADIESVIDAKCLEELFSFGKSEWQSAQWKTLMHRLARDPSYEYCGWMQRAVAKGHLDKIAKQLVSFQSLEQIQTVAQDRLVETVINAWVELDEQALAILDKLIDLFDELEDLPIGPNSPLMLFPRLRSLTRTG